MVTRNRKGLVGALACMLLFTGAAPSAFSRDDFDAVVRTIESRYHARRISPFLMRVAGLAVKASRPEGVKDLRAAVFEDQDFSPRAGDAEFDRAVRSILERNWSPLVRVWSRRDGEQTQIYSRPSGEDVRLFILTLEPDEAVVTEVRISPKTFSQWMNDPENIGSSLRQDSEEENTRATKESSPKPPPPLRHRDSPTP